MFGKHLVIMAAVVILISGCSSTSTKDIEVASEVDPGATFSGYKTYGWLGSAEIVNDPDGQWEPPPFDADAEIRSLLDGEMTKRGLTVVTDNPDLIVAFVAGADLGALGLKEDPDSKMEVLASMPVGGLMIALVDGESGYAIWAGVATGDVQANPDAKSAKKRLDYAVKQLIEQMPK